jgi:hypothetical protein
VEVGGVDVDPARLSAYMGPPTTCTVYYFMDGKPLSPGTELRGETFGGESFVGVQPTGEPPQGERIASFMPV